MADRVYQLEVQLDNGTTLNAGEFTAPQGPQGTTGKTPDIEVSATVGATVGTPSVEVVKGGTTDNPTFQFNFSNLKGQQGQQGIQGPKGDTGASISKVTIKEVS